MFIYFEECTKKTVDYEVTWPLNIKNLKLLEQSRFDYNKKNYR
jgi:hypothetical protein